MNKEDKNVLGCLLIIAIIIVANVVFGLKEWYNKHMDVEQDEYYVETICINDNEYYEIVHTHRCSCYDPFFKDRKKKGEFIKYRHTGFCPVCCDVDDVFDYWVTSIKNIEKQDGVTFDGTFIPEDCEWEPNYVYNPRTNKYRPTNITYHK